MEENNTQEETHVEQAASPALTVEQQMASLSGIAKMQHKAFDELMTLHLRVMLADVLDTRRSQKDRVLTASAIEQAFRLVLDAGVDITRPKTTVTGALAKKAANFAGVTAKAFDNKMLLLAQKMNEEQVEEKSKGAFFEAQEYLKENMGNLNFTGEKVEVETENVDN